MYKNEVQDAILEANKEDVIRLLAVYDDYSSAWMLKHKYGAPYNLVDEFKEKFAVEITFERLKNE